MGESSGVTVQVGPDWDEQRSDFQNATLQESKDGTVAYSIAARLPVDGGDVHAAAAELREKLERAVAAVPGLTFHVQVGPA